jgi:PAS domain S-box-containing protein
VTFRDVSWQVPLWYALAALAGAGGVVLQLRHRSSDDVRPVAYLLGLLTLGSLFGIAGAPVLGGLLPPGEGIARLIYLVAYPLLPVTMYITAMRDIDTYRQELRSLSDEALRQTQELLFIIEATRLIGEGLDLRAMLTDVVRSVSTALEADVASIVLPKEEEAGMLEVVARYQVLGSKHRVQGDLPVAKVPLLERVLRTQRQRVLAVGEDDGTLPALMGVRDPGALLIQPLIHKEQLLGVLVACRERGGGNFTEEHARLTSTMSVHIAGAIENTRLYRALQAKADELRHLLTQREAELKRETAILESMAEGVLVSDAEGCFIMMNRAAEQILDVPRRSVLGRTVQETLDVPVLRGELPPGVLMGLSDPYETSFTFDDRRIRVHAAPVRTEDGGRLGTVSVLQDVTREYLAEEAKREFIASISHELRTPLTAIKGYTEVLLSGMAGEMAPMLVKFLGSIRDNTTRMTSLTNNIISVAEIDRGNLGLNYQEVNVPELIEGTLKHYQERIESRELELDIACGDVPPVDADPNRLRIILDNLMSNAIKFTPPGGEVIVGCSAIQGTLDRPSFVSIWVADTGVGIPIEEQTQIWNRFYQGQQNLDAEVDGLGIGLAITKALVEAHGGRIWVDSTVDKGTTFTLLLPIHRGQGLANNVRNPFQTIPGKLR